MKNLPWRNFYASAIVIFFLVDGSLNMFASPAMIAEYIRWGYPSWFHFVTGLLEWCSALLIAWPVTRLIGSVLGIGVMLGAASTVLSQGEFTYSFTPMIVLVLLVLNVSLTLRAEKDARQV